jgi:hypothetical protein
MYPLTASEVVGQDFGRGPIDLRFGWNPLRVWPAFAKRGLSVMQIPDDVRKCVVFLGIKVDGKFVAKATGFAIAQEEHGMRLGYLITAQHVVSGLMTRGHDIWMRTNLKNGQCEETKIPSEHWRYHPGLPRESDVAAIMINDWAQSDIQVISVNGSQGIAASTEKLNVLGTELGEEIAIIGLFRSHYGVERNIPIVRSGHIAAFPEEPVNTRYCGHIDAYLIEAMSIGGLSGSPVFLVIPPVRLAKVESQEPGLNSRETTFTHGPAIFLLGLVHGHFDIQNLNDDIATEDDAASGGIHAGIGVVVPVEKILETINESGWAQERKKAIMENRISGGAAVADLEISDAATDKNPRHKEDFTSLLNAAARKKSQDDQTSLGASGESSGDK